MKQNIWKFKLSILFSNIHGKFIQPAFRYFVKSYNNSSMRQVKTLFFKLLTIFGIDEMLFNGLVKKTESAIL